MSNQGGLILVEGILLLMFIVLLVVIAGTCRDGGNQ